MFDIVLVEPEIPPNTGNVIRLAANTGARLHLIKPLGFSLDDKQLKRAGLDYWEEVDLRKWSSLKALQAANAAARFFYITTKSSRPYFQVRFEPGDFFVFGRETKGLPETLLHRNNESCLTIPMEGTRSLNLATAVAIILFEAMRQLRC